jgi:zinc transporter ZupT
MDFGPLQLLVFGIAAGLANVLGGLILFPEALRGRYRGSLKYLLALGAGFMLAVTFFEIIPKTIAIWQKTGGSSAESLSVPMVLVLAGYLATQFFEHTVAPHFHLGEDVHACLVDRPVRLAESSGRHSGRRSARSTLAGQEGARLDDSVGACERDRLGDHRS